MTVENNSNDQHSVGIKNELNNQENGIHGGIIDFGVSPQQDEYEYELVSFSANTTMFFADDVAPRYPLNVDKDKAGLYR